jgi:hypothetical protein
VFAATEIAISLLTLHARYGFPKFNMAYAARVVEDITAAYLLLALLLLISRYL